MKNLFKNRISVCNFICAVLMLILLVLQFSPFWYHTEGSTSIQGYVWFPTDNTAVDSIMKENVSSDFQVGDIIGMPIAVLLLGAAGVVCCIWKNTNILVTLLPIGCGLVGMFGYLGNAAFRLGANWGLHLIVCIAMVAVGTFAFVKEILAQKK